MHLIDDDMRDSIQSGVPFQASEHNASGTEQQPRQGRLNIDRMWFFSKFVIFKRNSMKRNMVFRSKKPIDNKKYSQKKGSFQKP